MFDILERIAKNDSLQDVASILRREVASFKDNLSGAWAVVFDDLADRLDKRVFQVLAIRIADLHNLLLFYKS